jgi:hypothetical protein
VVLEAIREAREDLAIKIESLISHKSLSVEHWQAATPNTKKVMDLQRISKMGIFFAAIDVNGLGWHVKAWPTRCRSNS